MSPDWSQPEPEQSAMARQQVGLVGVGRGLSHPLRIRIIISLLQARTELSSTDLAGRLDTSLGNIDYHVKCLLALGIIESKRTHQGRGSRQHFYSLVPTVRDVFGTVVEHQLPGR
jgi:predicted transcriptional regulator